MYAIMTGGCCYYYWGVCKQNDLDNNYEDVENSFLDHMREFYHDK